MKKFTFSLSRLQDFKTSLLDKEKLTLASLRVQLAQIEDEISRVETQLAALQREMQRITSEGTTVFNLKKIEYKIEASRALLKELYEKRLMQQQRVEAQLRIVMGVKSEVSGLEKLREKQREEYDYALKKENDEIIGELVSGQFVRKSSHIN
ncbi:MAG: flagellar export protein FliJ [Oscillospiraceae bacterium]